MMSVFDTRVFNTNNEYYYGMTTIDSSIVISLRSKGLSHIDGGWDVCFGDLYLILEYLHSILILGHVLEFMSIWL